MEYVTVESDLRQLFGAQPEDFTLALLCAYREAVRVALAELPIIEW